MRTTMREILISALIATFSLVTLTGCETPDDKTIEKARACLDSAGKMEYASPGSGATLAAQCEAQIASLAPIYPEAARIGFGAVLIEMGLIKSITTMAQNMQNGGSANTSSAMSVIALTPPTYDTYLGKITAGVENDGTLVNYANQSGSSGAIKLAKFIQFGYFVNYYTTSGSYTSGSTANGIGTAIAGVAGTAQAPQTATAILQAQQNACQGSGSSSSLCTTLTAAIGGATDPNTILTNVGNYVKSH